MLGPLAHENSAHLEPLTLDMVGVRACLLAVDNCNVGELLGVVDKGGEQLC